MTSPYYMIVTGRNLPDLEINVNAQIKNGAKPQGGVHSQGSLYAQAVLFEPRSNSQHEE